MDPFTISGDIVNKLKNKIITDEDIDIEVTEVGCVDNDTVYQIVEKMPQYRGGEEAMMKYVADNIKYPQEAKDKNISGRVFVSFVIEKDGSVNEVKVVRGIGGGCDEEAARVIKGMPKWEPGMQKGKPVRVNYMMPINFKLSDTQPKQPVKKSSVSKVDMKPDKNGVYQIVEEMPQYTGGEAAMMDFVAKNIVYPQEARDKEISGRVFVSFIVEKDGSVNEVNVKKGIGGGCDEEAVRVVKAMPKWKPGKMKGEAVRVSYQMPIFFKLQ
jgi:TonB family protein